MPGTAATDRSYPGYRADDYRYTLLQPQGSSCLKTARAGIAAAGSGGVFKWLAIGDSITEGTGPASGVEGRYASRARNKLRTYCDLPAGGRGYVPAAYAINPAPTQLFTLSGGASVASGATQGLGKRAVTLTGAGQTATLVTPVSTRIDLYATGGSGRGHFSYTVDGGASVDVNTAQFATTRDYVYSITGLAATTHTVVISWASGGTVVLTGAFLFNGDETNGVWLYDGAHHGQVSSYFAQTSDPWFLTVNTIQPHLVTIELGCNDYATAVATPAQMQANLSTLVAQVRAQCTVAPSIVLLPVWDRAVGTTPLAPWSSYVAAMRSFAQADGDIAVCDLYKRIGAITNSSQNGSGILGGDFIHPTDLGARMVSNALFDFLTYPVPA